MAQERQATTTHVVDVETGQRLEFQHNPNDIRENGVGPLRLNARPASSKSFNCR